MRLLFTLLLASCVVLGCNTKEKQTDSKASAYHKFDVHEVLHVKDYSYLRVAENGDEKWFAVPNTAVEVGKSYYYKNAMAMTDFESKELNKVFETVYFIEDLRSDESGTHVKNDQPTIVEDPSGTTDSQQEPEIVEGKITIEELIKNKSKYKGKIVTLSGEVTKYNPGIMGVNWFHISDGTDYEGKGDLTITTDAEVTMGTTVTFKGIVTLDKDIGAGYFYEILIEKALIIKE